MTTFRHTHHHACMHAAACVHTRHGGNTKNTLAAVSIAPSKIRYDLVVTTLIVAFLCALVYREA